MEDVFVYPLKNSNEYKEIINTICNKVNKDRFWKK